TKALPSHGSSARPARSSHGRTTPCALLPIRLQYAETVPAAAFAKATTPAANRDSATAVSAGLAMPLKLLLVDGPGQIAVRTAGAATNMTLARAASPNKAAVNEASCSLCCQPSPLDEWPRGDRLSRNAVTAVIPRPAGIQICQIVTDNCGTSPPPAGTHFSPPMARSSQPAKLATT